MQIAALIVHAVIAVALVAAYVVTREGELLALLGVYLVGAGVQKAAAQKE